MPLIPYNSIPETLLCHVFRYQAVLWGFILEHFILTSHDIDTDKITRWDILSEEYNYLMIAHRCKLFINITFRIHLLSIHYCTVTSSVQKVFKILINWNVLCVHSPSHVQCGPASPGQWYPWWMNPALHLGVCHISPCCEQSREIECRTDEHE